jgi:hypothetical protein
VLIVEGYFVASIVPTAGRRDRSATSPYEQSAILTGISTTTIAHGSGNTNLILTGTNFIPGVAVTWNGSYRSTQIIDATHVSVAIPASDFAQSE